MMILELTLPLTSINPNNNQPNVHLNCFCSAFDHL